MIYVPMLLGSAQVRFSDTKSGVDTMQEVTVLAPIADGAVAVDWDHATATDLAVADLEQTPMGEAQFLPLPAPAGKAKSYADWNKDFAGWLFRTQKLDLFKSPNLAEVSNPGESERDFRVRLQQVAHEHRDRHADKLRQKYAPKIAALQDRIRRAEQAVDRESEQAKQSQIQVAISVGATLLGAFLGRKAISATTIGKATTAARGAGRAIQATKDVDQAQENVAALQQQLTDLEAQFETEADALAASTDSFTEKLETVALTPTKANISVRLVALAWTPHWQDAQGTLTPAYR